ncbi:MAG: peptidoglycan-binding protein [Actinomycetes bacterium]
MARSIRLGSRTLPRSAVVGVVAVALVSTACVVTAGSAPAAAPTFKVALAQPVLRIGSTGPEVVSLQNRLGLTPATGYFGVRTAAAVTAYQRAHGIPATGVVATLTWASLGRTSASASTAGLPQLSYGMTDPAVSTLQSRLGMPTVTGYFGGITLAYVKALQRAARMSQTGVVTAAVWAKVGRVRFTPPVLAGTAAVAAAPSGSSGSTASRVLRVAASLAGIPYVANGYDPAHGFNCSSYTQWVYQQVGIDLGGAYTVTQYSHARHISRAAARPGDLVFYYNYSGNFIGHVGVYAGNNKFWHAPRPGRVVSLDTIYSPKVLFARVI